MNEQPKFDPVASLEGDIANARKYGTKDPLTVLPVHEALQPAFRGARVTTRMLEGGIEKVMPRRIIAPSTHYSPMDWWLPAVTTAMVGPQRDAVHAACADESIKALRKFNAPTYFVTPTLLTLLQQTDIDDTMPLDELPWPHDAMLFILPRQPPCCIHPTALGVARMAAWSVCKYDYQGVPGIVMCFADHLHGFGFINMPRQHLPVAECVAALDKIPAMLEAPPEIQKQEESAQRKSAAIVVRLMLAMTTPQAEVREPERIARESMTKGKRTKPALWHPIMLGDRVHVRLPVDLGGTHDSPRTHWRRGHFRRQACGEGRKERRTIWIQPMLVNAKEAQ